MGNWLNFNLFALTRRLKLVGALSLALTPAMCVTLSTTQRAELADVAVSGKICDIAWLQIRYNSQIDRKELVAAIRANNAAWKEYCRR